MKKFKRLLTMLLAIVMLVSSNLTAFASSTTNIVYETTNSESNGNVIVTDTGIYINGNYYSQEQFIELLNTAQKVQAPQTRSAIVLVAGTWWIPGVGEVVITAAGAVIVAGAVVAVGSWAYKAVTDWFAKRAAFNKSAENAVNSCNSNKRNHIMNPKHNWNKFNKNPKWNNVAPIIIKVLEEGYEQRETGNQYIRTLVYQGHTVVVRFIKDANGLVKYIGTAWCPPLSRN